MSNIRYRKLATKEGDGNASDDEVDTIDGAEYEATQYDRPSAKVPWKGVLYACVLFLGGTTLLTIGCLIVTGHIDQEKHSERFWPLILLGALMFIPGSYHTYFAYKAFTGDPDWRFEDFPDF